MGQRGSRLTVITLPFVCTANAAISWHTLVCLVLPDWLGNLDSNQDRSVQSRVFYR
jgi:hypothetical protein